MTRQIAFDDRSRQQTHFTTCYMCACRCGIKVTVENDRVRFTKVDVVDTNGTDTHVRNGLKDGDTIVRHPSDDVIEGVKVRVASPRK